MSEENSSANSGGGGAFASIGNAASGAASSATGFVSSTYNQAPDLGVTSTAQAAYQRAPDLGISSKLGLGGGAAGEAAGSDAQSGRDGENGPSGQGDSDIPHEGARIVQEAHEARVQRSRDAGPSSEKRVNASQSQIGIEDGIPTAAGAGTTLPQDETVQDAFRSGAERHEAKVPQDYESVDCPTKHAGNKDGSKTVPVGHFSSEGSGESNQKHAQDGGDEDEDESSQASSGNKKNGLGSKIKNTIKGDAKIVSGALARNEEKKEQGKAIKKGEA